MSRILRQNYENVIIADYVTDSLRIPRRALLGFNCASTQAVHVSHRQETSEDGVWKGRKNFALLRVTIDFFLLPTLLDKVFYEISFLSCFSTSTRQRRAESERE
jgi:hypothetical protein